MHTPPLVLRSGFLASSLIPAPHRHAAGVCPWNEALRVPYLRRDLPLTRALSQPPAASQDTVAEVERQIEAAKERAEEARAKEAEERFQVGADQPALVRAVLRLLHTVRRLCLPVAHERTHISCCS